MLWISPSCHHEIPNHRVREQVFAITVGLEEPAPTPEDVDAFVKREAQLNGYRADSRKWLGLALPEGWGMPVLTGMELGLKRNNAGLIVDEICGKLMGTPKMQGKHIPVIKHDVFLVAFHSLSVLDVKTLICWKQLMQIWPSTGVALSY